MANEPLEDKIEDKLKMTVHRCVPGSNFGFRKLGEDHDVEILINSQGRYLLSCVCGVTSLGNATDINLEKIYIRCQNYEGCNIQIPGRLLMDDGPRIYTIRINKD